MKAPSSAIAGFDFPARTRVVFGLNAVDRLGELAREVGSKRVLVVTDAGIAAAGHVARARRALEAAGLGVVVFDRVRENPVTRDVDECVVVAREANVDAILGLGGGSSLDTAKGCNFVLTNGGRMQDYRGYGKARKPMLPLIAVPTTSGTGSECQSYALITDEETHQKMACGDPKAAAVVAVLDPTLTVSQPRRVTANTGMDALGHAVETAVTRKRSELSWLYSREAFRLLVNNLQRVLESPGDLEARARMQLGAAYAGMAIELSMLGATHSAANPLTNHFGVIHGQAVGLMLPHVVRFNAEEPSVRETYRDLMAHAGLGSGDARPETAAAALASRLEALCGAADLPSTLADCGVTAEAIPRLAAEAATQWTTQFNPRPVTATDFESLYHAGLRLSEGSLGSPGSRSVAKETRRSPGTGDAHRETADGRRETGDEKRTQDTSVGSYFVGNYPPYSFWKPGHAGEALAALERPPAPGTPLGVYLHIPFCRKRCYFCYFRVYTDKNADEIQRYLNAAIAELALYADKPILGGRKPNFVYFGGGTPSYLSVQQLSYLTEAMKRLLPWDRAEEITFECEPGTLPDQKLRFLRDMGVTRLSIGVEHFDEDILRLNGRAHGAKEIDRAYEEACARGFPQINIDLIAGMMGDTDEKWQKAVKKTLEMRPDSVTIYQMEIPYNTIVYQEMKSKGLQVAPVPSWETKRRWCASAFEQLEAHGYTVTSGYTAVKDPGRSRFVYRDKLWTGADLIGLGVASFGHLGGTHYQNEHDWEPYIGRLNAGELPIYRALTPTAEERTIRELILQFKLGRIHADYFRRKFAVEIHDRFAEPLNALREKGYLIEDGEDLRLNRSGLLQVDRLVHEFFLPEHQHARYT